MRTNACEAHLNEQIQEENTACDFCGGVVVLDPNLEVFLDWPTLGNDRRYLKLGMILFNYETRADDTPMLTDLCVRNVEAAS